MYRGLSPSSALSSHLLFITGLTGFEHRQPLNELFDLEDFYLQLFQELHGLQLAYDSDRLSTLPGERAVFGIRPGEFCISKPLLALLVQL